MGLPCHPPMRRGVPPIPLFKGGPLLFLNLKGGGPSIPLFQGWIPCIPLCKEGPLPFLCLYEGSLPFVYSKVDPLSIHSKKDHFSFCIEGRVPSIHLFQGRPLLFLNLKGRPFHYFIQRRGPFHSFIRRRTPSLSLFE